jgi:carboxylesterase type B
MKQTGIDNVAHSEELRYMWRTLFEGYDNTNIEEFPEQDIVTHHRLLTLWTNFAKTLNPTPERTQLLQNVIWPSVSPGRPNNFFYLDINDNLTIRNFPKIGSYLGWNMIYDVFGEGDFDTY